MATVAERVINMSWDLGQIPKYKQVAENIEFWDLDTTNL